MTHATTTSVEHHFEKQLFNNVSPRVHRDAGRHDADATQLSNDNFSLTAFTPLHTNSLHSMQMRFVLMSLPFKSRI